MNLRMHQLACKRIAEEIRAGADYTQVIGHVVPGGGKSWLPGIVAEILPQYKILWLVPRISLRDQAEEDMKEIFGMEFRGSGNDINPLRGCRGCVTTHQAMEENPGLWRDELRRHKYITFCDESHHFKLNKDFEPFPRTRAFLSLESSLTFFMTGTIETSDGSFIYPLSYDLTRRGYMPDFATTCDARFSYSRADALDEGAVINVEFHHYDGPVKWIDLRLDSECEGTLSELDEADEGKGVFTAVSTQLGRKMFDEFLQHWQTHGDKALVVCATQPQTREYYNLCKGMNRYLAISDNPQSRDEIKAFKKTDRGILFTCEVAYEGLNEKRITHGCCLTQIRSKPWLEQMFARAWRALPGKDVAFWWVPDDPRMNRVIKRIHDEDVAYIGRKGADVDPPPPPPRSTFIPDSSDATAVRIAGFDGANIESLALQTPAQRELRELAKRYSIDPSMPEFKALLNAIGKVDEGRVNGNGRTVSEDEKHLRNGIADACRARDHEMNREWGETQRRLFLRSGKSTTVMTREELRRYAKLIPNL